MSQPPPRPGTDRREVAGFALLGAGAAWNVGTIGPAATAISEDLGVSLGTVGTLTGTTFFVGLVAAKLGAARLIDGLGTPAVARAGLLAAVAGNLLLAVSPVPPGVGIGRLLCGVSLGLALVLGPVLARSTGGARRVGVFGAAVTVGTAAALGTGSLLRAAGVDWRLDFVLAALVAGVALLALPRGLRATVSSGSVLALLRRSGGRWSTVRLELLFMATLGVPYVVGVWLVPYLTEDLGAGAAAAGLLAAALYLTAGFLRPAGARLEARRVSRVLLGGVAPLVAATGLLLLAVGAPGLAVVGVLVAGLGFAIPYAAMFDEAHGLFPGAGLAGVGLLSVGANLLPAALVPLLGTMIDRDRGGLVMTALASVSLVAGLANLRPVVPD